MFLQISRIRKFLFLLWKPLRRKSLILFLLLLSVCNRPQLGKSCTCLRLRSRDTMRKALKLRCRTSHHHQQCFILRSVNSQLPLTPMKSQLRRPQFHRTLVRFSLWMSRSWTFLFLGCGRDRGRLGPAGHPRDQRLHGGQTRGGDLESSLEVTGVDLVALVPTR